MRSLFRISLPFLLSACLAVSAFAQPVRTFVSTAGSDGNPCSRALPCRNFGAAIAAVSGGGEVVVLDSGGYGPVTIDKSVTLVAPAGVHAAIAPTVGDAVTVDAPGLAVVALRGLFLNGMGGANGIVLDSVGVLHVEGCVISNFATDGVRTAQGTGDLAMLDSVVRGNLVYGIALDTPGFVNAVFDRVRIERNGAGVYLERSNVYTTFRDCLIALSMDGDGVLVNGSVANIENCVVARNLGSGINGLNGTVRVSSTMVVDNGGNGFNRTAGTFLSWGNNRVRGNGTDLNGIITVVLQN